MARERIAQDPDSPSSLILNEFIDALEKGKSFELSALYELDYERFLLALELLREWRLGQYFRKTPILF